MSSADDAAPSLGQDVAALRADLETWLAGHFGEDARITTFEAPSGAGFSSETFLFDVEAGDGPRRHVLRTRPTGHTVFREYDMLAQYKIMSALGSRTDVPVPPVVAIEEDASVLGSPFLVMERVDGRVPSDSPPYTMEGWVKELPAREQSALLRNSLDVLARMHALDPHELGLGFLDRSRFGATGTAQQLGQYRDLLEWSTQGRPMPTLDAGLAWLEENRPSEEPEAVLNWGDARISNMIYDGVDVAAVLDWEMASLGPREVDVAWFFTMDRVLGENLGIPRLPGFPDRDGTYALYEELSGTSLGDLHWYEVFAAFRFATVMLRIAQRIIAMGHLERDSGVEDNNLGTRFLATILDLPSPGDPGPLG